MFFIQKKIKLAYIDLLDNRGEVMIYLHRSEAQTGGGGSMSLVTLNFELRLHSVSHRNEHENSAMP